jgi:tRNA threonylcarbamoyladenosine biosynthesis protein TsaE
MKNRTKFLSRSFEETLDFAAKFAKTVQPGDIICLFGDLGAGKTTFVRGFLAGFHTQKDQEVQSPTFTFLNVYEGKHPVYHFDLYRMRDAEDFLALGFDEYLYRDGISLIEWSERIFRILPQDIISVQITHEGENERWIEIDIPKKR